MSKEIIDETMAIATDIENQLKFFSEMGLEDIGGSAADTEPGPAVNSTNSMSAEAGTTCAVPERDASAEHQIASYEPARSEAPVIKQTGLFEVGSTGQQQTSRRARPALPILESHDPSLEAIREDIGDCRLCRLSEHRKTIVFGEGNAQARLVFVGEGPGAEEDNTGRPFVGRAGQLLDKIIVAIGLKREEVYIANIVKCRPPGNRTPERDEVTTCEPFLWRQLAFIRPDVIVALGSPAFQCLLRTREPITRVRGEWRDWNGIKVMPTFHPAFLLRSPDKKREVWEDMKKVRDYLNAQST